MDNSSLMNRENKKRQLRRQIVPPMYQNEQESEQAIRNAHKKTVRKRMTIFIIAEATGCSGSCGSALRRCCFWYLLL